MKVSLNWIRQFTDIDLSIDELVQKVGAQLGAVEEVVDLGKKYKGIVVAKVVACEKHPNADNLSLCTIDDGGANSDVNRDENGLVQVVCGAPNARSGMLVAWLSPGTTVPVSFDKDPLVLEAREIRGQLSNGMLASAHELGLSDDHSGLLEIDIDAAPGTPLADVYELNDYIIDIENKMFTHRPDCFGILGVARELAGIQNVKFTSPEWYLSALDRIKPGHSRLPLAVRNEIPELVPRFMMVAMADVDIRPSPVIMQSYLTRVGLKPISNVVDVTNYLMMLTGQPLHAFDYDKVKARDNEAETATIVVRKSRPGEKISLLNGKTIEPHTDAIMIATNTKLIAVGGVMGGTNTEVDENTRNIIIECANFDMYSVRKTSMNHGLFTDAVTRFNKGQSPLQNDVVLEEAVTLITTLSGAHVASDVFDLKGELRSNTEVEVSQEFINARLGLNTDAEEMATRLRNVEFEVDFNGQILRITAPFWRTDIEIPEDVVEEIGRLIGYDHLPLDLPKRDLKPAEKDKLLVLKSTLRDSLVGAGANEVLTYSFVHGNLLDKAGQDKGKAFQISNALSPDLQYYRLSLTPSLLEKVHPNIKAGYDQFALFEFGLVHGKTEIDEWGLPSEFARLAFVFAAEPKTASSQYAGAPYYQAQAYLRHLAGGNFERISLAPFDQAALEGHEFSLQMAAPFEPGRCALIKISEKVVGIIGEYKPSVQRQLKLPGFTAGFEIFLSAFEQGSRSFYAPIPKFPRVQQDISLRVAKEMNYAEVFGVVRDNLDIPPNAVHKLEPTDIYEKDGVKHVTLRLTIASHERTLTDKEVNALLDKVAEIAHEKLGIERI